MTIQSQIAEERDNTTPATVGSPVLTIERVSTPEGFDALQAEWDQLLERSDARIFQTFEWQRTWWRHYGEGKTSIRLTLLLVRDGAELVGIAPLCIETAVAVWPITYRLLIFTGRGPSDYLDLIACRGRERDVASAVAKDLVAHRDEFDVLLFDEVRDSSPSGEHLANALRSAGLAVDRFISEQCPRLAMADTFEATVQRFSRNKRQRMMKSRRAVMQDAGAVYEVVKDAAAVQSAMDEFIRIHQARWNTVGHAGVFADPAADRFHRDVVRALFSRGWLLLAFLRVNGERLAGDYGLVFRGEFMTYLGGARGSEDFLKHSPGRALLFEIMEQLLREGVRVFDFMRGTERYKYEMGGIDVPNWTIMAFGRPGPVAPLLHRVALLRVSLSRRAAHEWLHLSHHARKHGIVSRGFAGYLVRRAATVAGDGLQKLRAPEKTVIMGKSDE